ncbi:hypothetical protein MPSEU_001019100 [Mayamaea pseudoterrestris]|nr:hypothetical protein MPSEU_001019100 [Mayamaea pseudoterrestris]
MYLLVVILISFASSQGVTAFFSLPPSLALDTTTRAIASRRCAFFNAGEYEQYDDDNMERHGHHHSDALAHNLRRTDPLIFLTQRAIQSFMVLLASTRDPHTSKWIEDNYNCQGIEQYHGTGAFNLTLWPSWESLLTDMLQKPEDVVVVSAKRRGRGHGGWSKNNPYLEERWVEFNIDINPPSIVTRILSVREQIGKEWLHDLDTMVVANEQILTSYKEKSTSARSDECLDEDAESPSEDCLATETKATKSSAYDRTSMLLMDNTIEFESLNSSPQRKGNFDLLILLATQESIHRVLREYRDAGLSRQVSFEWLRTFYIDRVATFFDGSQEYGRADDFLEELLLTPPSMKTVSNKVELVDPFRIAEDVIRTRSMVGMEWKEKMKDVSAAHLELRRLLLLRHMENAATPSPFAQAAGSEGFE